MLVLAGRLERDDIPGLCERARATLEASGAGTVVVDVGGLADTDAVALDAVARVVLTARRLGRRAWVRHADDRLRRLVALVGLCEIMAPRDPES